MLYYLLLVFLLTSAFWGFVLYERILYHREHIERILSDLEKDYDAELLDKRTFRRHRDKLLQDRNELVEILNYIKTQARANRIYKRFYLKYNKELCEKDLT